MLRGDSTRATGVMTVTVRLVAGTDTVAIRCKVTHLGGSTMSTSGRTRSARWLRRLTVMALGILLIAPIASAGPSLWLYPKEAGPREGGHVVPPGTPFTLVIENRGKDSVSDTAFGVKLVVAVADPAAVSALELVYDGGETMVLDPNGWEVGVPTLPCSFKPMSRHGEYPAAFLTVTLDELTEIGDLVGGQSVEISVTVEGDEGLRVHFDAMATGWKTTGQGLKCSDVSNPSGHDVTVADRRGGGDNDDCGRVSISKTADPRAVDLGQEVLFVIEILNNGTCDLTEVVLQDFVPAVEDDAGSYPAFRPVDDAVPPYLSDDGFLLEWPYDSPLLVGESLIVELAVIFDELLADQQRVVNRACITAAELKKPRCTSAGVMVGNAYGEDGPAGPGFWCHAVRWVIEDRPRVPVDGEELLAWLELVDADSGPYSELYLIFVVEDPEASLVAAADLLCNPQLAGGAADRLARHFLTLRLNVVSGRLDPALTLGQLCEGDEALPDDPELETTAVGDLINEIELGFVGADDEQLNFWSEVVDAVNNSRVPGEFGCTVARSVSSRHRTGHGKPGGKSTVSRIEN